MNASSPEAATPRPAGRLGLKVLYGLGSLAYGVKDNGFQVLLLLFYNQAMGLNAGLAGLAIMIALSVDAVIDPLIGYCSDRLRSPLGRRHPFMYAAAVPVALSYLFLFSPPHGLGQLQLFSYLLLVSVLVRIFIAVYEIPSAALVAELTYSYDERTAFISYRYFFGWVGGLTMAILAFSVFLHTDAAHPIAQLNVAGYAKYGVAASIIMFLAILISASGTQSAVRPIEAQARLQPPRNLWAELVASVSTVSAAATLLATLCMMLATGLYWALGTFFNIYAFGLSPAQISLVTASSFISAGLSLFTTPWLSSRFDKRSVALVVGVCLVLLLPLPLILSLFGLLPTLASGGLVPFLFTLNVVATTFLIAVPTLLASMSADVVEEIEVRTGQRFEGMIFSLNVFAQKFASGLSVLGSTIMLSAAHFPTHAVAGQVPGAVITHLSSLYIFTLATLYIASLICIFIYRITRERHVENLRLLSERRDGVLARVADSPAIPLQPVSV